MSVTGMFIWLGGGQPAEAADSHERTGYTVTGTGVALFASITAGVTAVALGRAGWPVAAVLFTALLGGLLTGLLGRALAGAPPTARPDRPAGTPNLPAIAARLGAALLAGLVVAELATTVVFDGTVDRILDERAAAAATTTPAVTTAQDELDRVAAQRSALDDEVARAATDLDSALIVARCEFNPTPACPQTKITGVPGRGPEAGTANEMLEDARTTLTTAQARITPLDQQVTAARTALDNARTTAESVGDRGFGARWAAAHEHTTGGAGPQLLRLLTWVVFVFLAALPLLLRWWRGETGQERRRAADAVRDRAERAADVAIAEKTAHTRAETAAVRADQQLIAARLAAEADTTIDRERQRTRVIAALGGLEIGITDRDTGSAAALPAGTEPRPDHAATLPVPIGTGTADRGPTGWELPLIGAVPFSGTATRWIGPLVPGFVSSAVEGALDTASRPLRTAQQLLTEAEEVTFTLRRTRQTTTGGPDRGPRSAAAPRDTGAPADLTLGADAIVSSTTRLEPAPGPAPAIPEPRELPPGR